MQLLCCSHKAVVADFFCARREFFRDLAWSAQGVVLVLSAQVVVVFRFNVSHVEVLVQLLCCSRKAAVACCICLCKA